MIALLQNLQKRLQKWLYMDYSSIISIYSVASTKNRSDSETFFPNIALKFIDILKKYINDHCYWLSSAIYDGKKYQCIVILFPWDLRQLRHRVHWQSGWHVWGAAEQYLFLGKPKTRTKQSKFFKLGIYINKAR